MLNACTYYQGMYLAEVRDDMSFCGWWRNGV